MDLTPDPLAEINQIVRDRYERGLYSGCRFEVHPGVFELMRATQPMPGPERPWTVPGSGTLGLLTGIPVVIEESLPEGGWRLVQMSRDLDPPFTRHDVILKMGTTSLGRSGGGDSEHTQDGGE